MSYGLQHDVNSAPVPATGRPVLRCPNDGDLPTVVAAIDPCNTASQRLAVDPGAALAPGARASGGMAGQSWRSFAPRQTARPR